ncbi:hypothetical protein JCM10914_3059 [Paenibacillus sp. JCM 10914]|nr:hypothetical protein JCM10914_3059 [Paenibacillus sp. JCM 10914]
MSLTKVITASVVVIAMAVLFYLMTVTIEEIRIARERLTDLLVPLLKLNLWGFLVGVLLEWRSIRAVLTDSLRINGMLLPAVLLTILVFIPGPYWVEWLGLRDSFMMNMLLMSETHLLLCVVAGVLMMRSLHGRTRSTTG